MENSDKSKRILRSNHTDSVSFYSRGKFLVTGEYLILKGAEGLALPLQFGQKMDYCYYGNVKNNDNGKYNTLEWLTRVSGRNLFNALFRIPGYDVVSASDNARALFIGNILASAAALSELDPISGKVESSVEFNLQWGLGSSSSLISNIAYMFDVNPFVLHFSVSRGSGYDIACARSDSPIMYRLKNKVAYPIPENGQNSESNIFNVPVYRSVDFKPVFRDKLFFAWTGKKQDSALSVDRFLSNININDLKLHAISQISSGLLDAADIDDFKYLLREHDLILSGLLGETPVSEGMFKNFPGFVKSLGAWGGDFVMIGWKGDVKELINMLKKKGINVVFPYNKIIHSANGM